MNITETQLACRSVQASNLKVYSECRTDQLNPSPDCPTEITDCISARALCEKVNHTISEWKSDTVKWNWLSNLFKDPVGFLQAIEPCTDRSSCKSTLAVPNPLGLVMQHRHLRRVQTECRLFKTDLSVSTLTSPCLQPILAPLGISNPVDSSLGVRVNSLLAARCLLNNLAHWAHKLDASIASMAFQILLLSSQGPAGQLVPRNIDCSRLGSDLTSRVFYQRWGCCTRALRIHTLSTPATACGLHVTLKQNQFFLTDRQFSLCELITQNSLDPDLAVGLLDSTRELLRPWVPRDPTWVWVGIALVVLGACVCLSVGISLPRGYTSRRFLRVAGIQLALGGLGLSCYGFWRPVKLEKSSAQVPLALCSNSFSVHRSSMPYNLAARKFADGREPWVGLDFIHKSTHPTTRLTGDTEGLAVFYNQVDPEAQCHQLPSHSSNQVHSRFIYPGSSNWCCIALGLGVVILAILIWVFIWWVE